MRAPERVGIKRLKNNLSAYIRQVRKGASVLITDRDEVVAELQKPRSRSDSKGVHPLLTEWLQSGKVVRGRTLRKPLPKPRARSRPGTSQRLLDRDRGD